MPSQKDPYKTKGFYLFHFIHTPALTLTFLFIGCIMRMKLGSVFAPVRRPQNSLTREEDTMRKTMLVGIMVILASLVGCGGNSSPTAPAVTTPAVSTIVYAYPPAGVSNAVWAIGFGPNDMLLRRPGSAVNLQLPTGLAEATTAAVQRAVVAANAVGTSTTFGLFSGGDVFVVSIDPSVAQNCGGSTGKAACTSLTYDANGNIVGGTMRFYSESFLAQDFTVLHELVRTLGVMGYNPNPGLMNAEGWANLYPSDEEKLMILGRYPPPLLAEYAPAPGTSSVK